MNKTNSLSIAAPNHVANTINRLVTMEGAMYAFVSGVLLGAGYSLLNDESEDDKKFARKVGIKTLGVGFFVLGVYLWSPTLLREAWMMPRLRD